MRKRFLALLLATVMVISMIPMAFAADAESGVPGGQGETPSSQSETPTGQEETPTGQEEIPTDQEEIPTDQEEMPDEGGMESLANDDSTISVGDATTFMGALDTINGTAGTYTITLTDNITLEATDDWKLTSASNVTILGNGHSITIPDGGKGLTVNNQDATLTLGSEDGQDTLIIQAADGATTTSALVTIDANNGAGGTLNMYDGVTLQNNNSQGTTSVAGGVAVIARTKPDVDADESVAVFNMYGGEICNNTYTATGTTDCGGGGVRVYGPYRPITSYPETKIHLFVFNMSGGTISNNTAKNGNGGGVYVAWGTFNFTGGTIEGNLATEGQRSGGGINVTNGDLKIDGGSDKACVIRENNVVTTTTSIAMGAGVNVVGSYYYPGLAEIKNAQILNNGKTSRGTASVAQAVGGAIVTSSVDGTIIENCVISGNECNYGSGIVVSGAENVTISNCTLTGNGTNSQGGAVRIGSGSSVTISDSTITGNVARTGGAIWVVGGSTADSVTLSNTKITGNKATQYGGGIYIEGGFNSTSKVEQTATVNEGCVIANNTAAYAGADIYTGKYGTIKVSLPDAASMEQEFGTSGVKIDGWYSDPQGSRYSPNASAKPVVDTESLGNNVALVASYKVQVFTVTNTLNNVTSNNSSETITQGSTYTAKLTPSAGYALTTDNVIVTMGGNTVENAVTKSDGGTVTVEIENVSGDIVVTATAKEDKNNNGTPDDEETKYSISYEQGNLPQGVTADNMPTKAENILSGTEQTVSTAKPTAEGYIFDSWSVNPDVTIDENGTFTMPGENVTFTAQWKEDKNNNGTPDEDETFNITVTVGSGGSAEPNGTVSVGYGGSVTITFTPDPGYEIDSVIVDGQKVVVSGSSYTFSNVVANHTLEVSFKSSYVPPVNPGTTYYIDASAGQGGPISPNGRVSVAAGSSRTFTIAAGERYEIADVLVDGVSVGAVSSYTFSNVQANHTITVTFRGEGGVADPDDTGVSTWLNTDEHIAYLQGYGNSLFGPEDNITRAEVAQMFYNLLRNKNVPITVSFTDVEDSAWYTTAVNTLASLGILRGVGNDQFAPERAITRAEFTVIAMRFAVLPTGGANIFSDISASDWFYSEVIGAVKYGWITGYTDGTFRPLNPIARSEVTAIVNRMLARSADETYVDHHTFQVTYFSDVRYSYWAYYHIVEATTGHSYTKDNGGETWFGLI